MSGMDASIVIVVKNGGDNFPRLLERIYSQQFNGSYEVIVIDSGSTDGTLDAARRYPVILREIAPAEFHHSRTRNLGLNMATGEYVVFITSDALPLDDRWLDRLTAGFTDRSTAMTVGRQIAWQKTKPPEKFFYKSNFPEFKIMVKSGAADYYHYNVFISNVNAAYRRDILLKYKFDEQLVLAEDKEIAARFLKGGYSIIYEPEAAVYHSHNEGLSDLFNKHLDFGLANRQGVGELPKTAGNVLSGTAGYVGSELKYLAENRLWQWVPYVLVYEAVKYAGLWLGKTGILKGPTARSAKRNHERTISIS